MSALDFIRKIPERGVRGTLGETKVAYRRRTNWLERRSTNPFETEWDVLVVLDACRTDLLDSVADEYDFVGGGSSIYSVGGTSPEWIENTFGGLSADTLRETGYVTGNPHSSRVDIDAGEFGVFDEVWRYAWDSSLGVIPPRALTERAIATGRERDVERLVVHYMQPHIPFLDAPELTRAMSKGETDEFGNPATRTVWDRLRDGEVDESTVWAAYRQNLRVALDEVELLRENIDANRLVITADHGNGMGELGQYGHGRNARVDSVCRVPWDVTDATDTGEFTPTVEPEPNGPSVDGTVEDRLSQLGYK